VYFTGVLLNGETLHGRDIFYLSGEIIALEIAYVI